MSKKKTNFNKEGISQIPNDKPVLYRIKSGSGTENYVGVAQRGRAQARISEHLGKIPGATVEIEQFSRIDDARKKEANVIKRNQPPYNEQGK
jgi:hypothetical protein